MEIHVTPIDGQVEEAPPVEAPPTEGNEVSEDRPPRRSRGGRNRSGRGRGRGRGRGDSQSRDDAPASDDSEVTPEPAEAAEPDDDSAAASTPATATKLEPRQQREREPRQPGPDPEVEKVAAEVLDYLLGSMDVTVQTFVSEEDSTDSDVAFELEGVDSGLLIGRRGETLQSLQFLLNMIINRRIERSCYVTIDVEGYRERRRENLAETADRAADRAVDSGREQTLQPMTAADRRIIHMTLAEHPDVMTESSGEGDQRRVVILLKD